MPKFTVDTHLFRELGELLVGRDSTALIELIKNSYDADATEVTVHGEQLDRPDRGRIVVSDNGTGMTQDQFENGFLRIASRLKEEGDRRSALLQRRFTGAKGIGRLAAHKLARKLEIESVAQRSDADRRVALHAGIDWDEVEQCETLDELEGAGAISMETVKTRSNARTGTTLTLSKLRRAWTPAERARFFSEVQSFDPPTFLQSSLPRSVLPGSLLFDTPVVRDAGDPAAGFSVRLEGDFAAGEEYWRLVADIAAWVIEIRADRASEKVHFSIAPTKQTMKDNPGARGYSASIPHPHSEEGPFFDARILVREGKFRGKRDQRVWAAESSGIRVYLEGFRVLPYGEERNDWLGIDFDYTRRPRQLQMLQDLVFDAEGVDPNEGLIRLPHNNYHGAVFLTQERAPTMRVLVNREGFVPEAGFDTLVKLVRTGVDLCTRVRAAAALGRRKKWKDERKGGRKPTGEPEEEASTGTNEDQAADDLAPPPSLPDRFAQVAEQLQAARSQVDEGDVEAARQATLEAEKAIERARELIDEDALLRVLASVGTQMAAFVHEINALLGAAQTVEQAVRRLLDVLDLTRDQRRRLRETLEASRDLKRGLERQASYLMDVVTPDARRRRSRQRLGERLEAAIRLIQHQAERRRIDIHNRIPKKLKSPPMFPAELTTLFANLLTNAVKAAGEDGRIEASATERGDWIIVKIQNTGTAVDLEEAERWFRPFESTTSEINPVLGQGMGLGLTITRSVLDSYGARVTFVKPAERLSTAVEIAFPKPGASK